MRYFLLLTFSMFSFADDHSISTDFSDCDGKVFFGDKLCYILVNMK